MKKIFPFMLCLLLFAGWYSATAQPYHEDDKTALRAFLRQPSATPGMTNADKFGVDTTNWTFPTNENWITQVIGLTWGEITPKRLTEISWVELGFALAGSLDLSGCSALEYLECGGHQLTALNVSNNSELTELLCSNNQLTALNVSNNTKLERLSCGGNQLTVLDVSKNTELEYLECSENQLTALNVSNNTELTDLRCSKNQLTVLDVSNNPELYYLECEENYLTALNVFSENSALQYLYCAYNRLTVLDVTTNDFLMKLDCSNNRLTTLDVSNNTAYLEELKCGGNRLTTLDVSNSTGALKLHCEYNHLTALNLNNILALSRLYCYGNAISLADLKAASDKGASGDMFLGTQILAAETAILGNEVTVDDVFNGVNTNFDVRKNGSDASGTDYNNLGNGKFKFLTAGAYTVDITNDDIISGSGYPATVVATYLASVNGNSLYHPSDKAALRAFLRQPSATTGKTNAEVLGVTDTTNWTTNESWIAQVTNLFWNEETPKR
ncbi:MAG: hypothetical protein LBN37_08185, partial [Bacteroidales bacterium]|nr:hypothetical protein [Bacteroidales bacterium]